ncbi:methyltransferase family protein [Dictyobacter kobayashii]|uniref:Isoprenylcysteine carboxyl methyltransferase n=1 Tax=Dictyobacter kobayashii TaxID=2014872 RepID=A0A402AR49_9CHLR|nr:isoprenylcysteine carboxylmethyltransferase family protein [Dictyobacter kobayashii]GCE21568.1 isoprenylcysteine carboxyl methyltransferase [Dictyobacter kobayashii]
MVNLKVLFAEFVYLLLFFSLPLFLAAGTLAWPAGWTFLILFFGFTFAITYWLFKHNPALLTERMAISKSDQKVWDKIGMAVTYVVFLAWLVLMPLDAVRFRWSQVPTWLQIVGAVVLIGSFWLFYATFRENSFLSPMVRIQEERGQTVVSTGPYHYVRHPMYAAALLYMLSTALLLGSLFGLLGGLLLIIMIAIRAVLEERTLQQELQGYSAYKTQVKYRLIPYVW